MAEITYTPEHAKKVALARLDLVKQWEEFRRKSNVKLQADYDFVKMYNSEKGHLFNILGKISRGSLHRWKTEQTITQGLFHNTDIHLSMNFARL